MLTIIITPCLLGFDVKTRFGAFERSHGIFTSFGELVKHLIFTPDPFTVELR